MTVTTVFATAPGGNGSLLQQDAVYATARAMGSVAGRANHIVGQEFTGAVYNVYQSCLIFDTSSVPDADTVSDVVFSPYTSTDNSTTNDTVWAASSSYNGGVVTTGDQVAGASLSGQTDYASWNMSSYTTASYEPFTSVGAAFNNAINKTGNTALMLYAAEQESNTAPTDPRYVTFLDADAAGTTTDAKLDITHASTIMSPLIGTRLINSMLIRGRLIT